MNTSFFTQLVDYAHTRAFDYSSFVPVTHAAIDASCYFRDFIDCNMQSKAYTDCHLYLFIKTKRIEQVYLSRNKVFTPRSFRFKIGINHQQKTLRYTINQNIVDLCQKLFKGIINIFAQEVKLSDFIEASVHIRMTGYKQVSVRSDSLNIKYDTIKKQIAEKLLIM